MELNNDITQIVSKEIIEKTLDLTIDFAEIGLDQFITNDVLGEIPIVKSITAFYKIGNSVINRHNTKKILNFFQEFNNNKIDDIKFNEFKHKFNTDQKYQSQVTETIILLNERFLQVEKSKILANLIIAHIENNLTWDELTNTTIVLDIIQPKAFSLLEEVSKFSHWSSHDFGEDIREGLILAYGIGYKQGTQLFISETGKQLFNYGIKPANLNQ
ncbi:hypothetical protein D3C72_729940 [compost metagenome]